jgi:hypothetical protein
VRRVAALALAVVLLTGCEGLLDRTDGGMDGRASRALRAQVAAIEYAIAGHNLPAASEGLVHLRDTTVRWTAEGKISEGRAVQILGAADAVERSLAGE